MHLSPCRLPVRVPLLQLRKAHRWRLRLDLLSPRGVYLAIRRKAFGPSECKNLGKGIVLIPVGATVALVGVILAATGARVVRAQAYAGGTLVAVTPGSYNGNNERRGARLELVGLAPLADRESKPSGLAAQWVF